MRPTKRELRILDLMRDYDAIRKRSFGKTIPPVSQVAFAFVPGKTLCKVMGEECYGFNVNGPNQQLLVSVIAIAEESNDFQQRMTLVHEMAHFKVDTKWGRRMGHGKYFKIEMRRLARIGELDGWL